MRVYTSLSVAILTCGLSAAIAIAQATNDQKVSVSEISVDQLARSVHLIGRTGIRHGQMATFTGKWREHHVLRGPKLVFELQSVNGAQLKDRIEFRQDDVVFSTEMTDLNTPSNGDIGVYYGFETGGFFGVPKEYHQELEGRARDLMIDIPFRSGERIEAQTEFCFRTKIAVLEAR